MAGSIATADSDIDKTNIMLIGTPTVSAHEPTSDYIHRVSLILKIIPVKVCLSYSLPHHKSVVGISNTSITF